MIINKFDLLNLVYQDNNLKMSSKLIMQYLVYRSSSEGSCFPSVTTMAKDLCVSDRTIQRNMRKLEAAGYIKTTHRYSYIDNQTNQLSNMYSFNLYDPEEVENATANYKVSDEAYEFIKNNSTRSNKKDIKKVKIIERIYKDERIKAADKLLLVNIIHRANKKGINVTTLDTIAEELNVCVKTVIAMLKRVVESGYVTLTSKYNYLIFSVLSHTKKVVSKACEGQIEREKEIVKEVIINKVKLPVWGKYEVKNKNNSILARIRKNIKNRITMIFGIWKARIRKIRRSIQKNFLKKRCKNTKVRRKIYMQLRNILNRIWPG